MQEVYILHCLTRDIRGIQLVGTFGTSNASVNDKIA